MDKQPAALPQGVGGELYLLLEECVELPGMAVWDMPLPADLAAVTIETCLWSAEEKAKLREHRSWARYTFATGKNPVEDFIMAYRELWRLPGLVGIANPRGATAHTARWINRMFEEGLEGVARRCPPLHLWTGLLPVQMEASWQALLEGRASPLWLRTVGYDQFGLMDLAYPLNDLRDTAWIHALFEVLFDWMYYEKMMLRPGMGIEVPERGRFVVRAFGVPGVVALWPYGESDSISSASSF